MLLLTSFFRLYVIPYLTFLNFASIRFSLSGTITSAASKSMFYMCKNIHSLENEIIPFVICFPIVLFITFLHLLFFNISCIGRAIFVHVLT